MAEKHLTDAAAWILASNGQTKFPSSRQAQDLPRPTEKNQVVEEFYEMFRIQQSAKQTGKEPTVSQAQSSVDAVKCPDCDKNFRTAQQMRQHSVVHSGERKYACDQDGCEKRFKQLSHLQQHRRLHTGERPYKCAVPGCTKAFTQQGNLNHHLNTTTHDFSSSLQELSAHSGSVSNDASKGSLDCDVCCLSLPSVAHFEVHREQLHPEFVSLREVMLGTSPRKRGRPKAAVYSYNKERRSTEEPGPARSPSKVQDRPAKLARYTAAVNDSASDAFKPVFPSLSSPDQREVVQELQKPEWLDELANCKKILSSRADKNWDFQAELSSDWRGEIFKKKDGWSNENMKDCPSDDWRKFQGWPSRQHAESQSCSNHSERSSNMPADGFEADFSIEKWNKNKQEKVQDLSPEKRNTLLRYSPEIIQELFGADMLNMSDEKRTFLLRLVQNDMSESQRRVLLALLSVDRSTSSASHNSLQSQESHSTSYNLQQFSVEATQYQHMQRKQPYQ